MRQGAAGVTQSMGSTAARGAVITMGGQGARMIIQTLGVVILSRLLEPSEFGLFAMVLVIVGIGEVLRDFGLSAAVIQAREITREQQSNLFWINTAIGCALCAVLVVCSGLVADFYGEPDLAKVAVVVSAVFVMNGMSTQYRAALNRELRFTALAVSEVVSMGLGLIAGIGVAVAGFGVWALVVQQLVQAFAILAMTVVCGRWVPGRPTLGAEMKPLLTFGWNFGCTQLINYLSRNIDTIVIGRRFGTESLGFYNRAYQLLTLPLNQINGPATKVAFPVLSRISDDRRKYEQFLLRGQSAILHLVACGFSFAIALAGPIVVLILGDQWSASAEIFQALAISGIIQTAAFGTYWVFLSKGLSGENLRYTLVTKALLVALVLIGSNWGVLGVAVGYSLATILSWPIGLLWIRSVTEAPVREMAVNCVRTILAYGVAAVVAALVAGLYSGSDFVVILVGFASYAAAIAVMWFIFRPFRADVKEIYDIRRLLSTPKTVGE